jgi:hypothetical protein
MFVPWANISSGERTLVALEVASSIAAVRATQQLTILVGLRRDLRYNRSASPDRRAASSARSVAVDAA